MSTTRYENLPDDNDDSLELKCPLCHNWHLRTEADESSERPNYADSACDDCVAEDEPS